MGIYLRATAATVRKTNQALAHRDDMATSQIGIIKIPVDGAWDIADLRNLSESLSETYGLFIR
jgi:hypothetical protein